MTYGVRVEEIFAWPEPAPLVDELPPVPPLDLATLPESLGPLVEDISERMQTPPDYAGAANVVSLAGCVNRRAFIMPKKEDDTWRIIPNLWGAIIGPPGFMKSPVLQAVTEPHRRIELNWRAEFDQTSSAYALEREKEELHKQAWREQVKASYKKQETAPDCPVFDLQPPKHKRLILTDATYEKLHEILSDNPAGILVIRDELTGWLADLDKQGRESERGFYLQSWNGDAGFTIDRIGRGSIHVPAVCVSLFGNIQPSRLRSYLYDVVAGGPTDDGLFQRFQVIVWPDHPKTWKLVDRPANRRALDMAEKVYSALANLDADNPLPLRFASDAQELFFDWWTELELRIRGESTLPPALIAHLSKYRKLMPSLAALFELADGASADVTPTMVSLRHTQQAAAMCEYLEGHARRVYGCITSPERRAAHDLARHIKNGDLQERFSTRDVYQRCWAGLDTPSKARPALELLAGLGWIRDVPPYAMPLTAGRHAEMWESNPKVVAHE